MPFGYDLVVVNPADRHGMYGPTGNQSLLGSRWSNALSKWANGKRRVLILMNNLTYAELAWLPIDANTMMALAQLESAGQGNFLGNVTSVEPLIRRFLTDNKQAFTVNTYLRYDTPDPYITVNSSVDSTLLTSFTYKKDGLEIIFIPFLDPSHLSTLFASLDTPANAWGLPAAQNLVNELSGIDEAINQLHAKRDSLYQELNELNAGISKVIESDVYLTRAIGHYDATKASENPSPEGYYGAIEAIEKAFSSERAMQEELELSKSYVDKVMRRANEFRHEAKSGQAPTALTNEEISDFNVRVNKVISSYINYLLK